MIRKLIPYFYCVALAFVSLAVFSYTTSPFYFEPSSGDSAMFYTIGRNWAEGYLPYVCTWDSKGPIIFFVNCIGYLLTGSVTGVFILQFLCLSVTLCLLYQLLRSGFSTVWSCVLLFFITLTLYYDDLGGNCVEEYLLPLLAWAYALMYRWGTLAANGETREHPAKYAIVYGMVIGFSLLTRLTNAMGVCAVAGVIGIWLMVKGSWRNLLANILALILGFAIIFVPFAVYFAYKGAFGEMWFGTIIYNFNYAGISGVEMSSAAGIAKAVLVYFTTFFVLFTGLVIILLWHHRRLAGIMLAAASALPLVWFLNGTGFAHYGIISLPLVSIAFVELRSLSLEAGNKKVRLLGVSVISVVSLVVMLKAYHGYRLFTIMYNEDTEMLACRNFMEGVPVSYRQSFVGYNTPTDFYVYNDIRPYYRFFTLQDFQSSPSPRMAAMLRHEFANGDARWILVKGNAIRIASILERRYYIYKRNREKNLTLYHIK